MIHPVKDAHRVRNDRVGAGGAQVVGGKAFEDFVGQPVGGGERELQGVGVGHTRAVEVGRLDFQLLGQRLDLRGGAVDEHDANVQRAEHRDVEQDVGEVFVRDDGAVDADDERLLAKARDVLQDTAQISRFHVGLFSMPGLIQDKAEV